MKRIVSLLMVVLIFGSTLLSVRVGNAYADTTNLMSNPSAEVLDGSGSPINWIANTWGTSTTTLSLTSDAHSGNEALSVVTASLLVDKPTRTLITPKRQLQRN
jgi:hypothetical protein